MGSFTCNAGLHLGKISRIAAKYSKKNLKMREISLNLNMIFNHNEHSSDSNNLISGFSLHLIKTRWTF